MNPLRHFLARLCWRAAFWLEGIKPTDLIGPREAALHERRGIERLARDIGVRLREDATPDEDQVLRRALNRAVGNIRERLPASIQKREHVPTARDLDSQFKGKF